MAATMAEMTAVPKAASRDYPMADMTAEAKVVTMVDLTAT